MEDDAPKKERDTQGARALSNPRHERFARALVDNPRLSGLDAWAQSGSADAARGNRDSLKSAAARARKRPEVRARIEWLTAERRRLAADAAQGELTAHSLVELMHRLSDVLTRVHERAEAENASEGKLLKLRRTMTAHAARLSAQLDKLTRADGTAPDAGEDVRAADLLGQVPAMKPCTCPRGARG